MWPSRLLNTIGVSIQKLYLDLSNAMGEDVSAGGKGRIPAVSESKGKELQPLTATADLTALARDGEAGSSDRKSRRFSG